MDNRSRSFAWLIGSGWLPILVFLPWIAAVSVAETRPESFPEVALSTGSTPRYAAMHLDPWGRQIAYVLFDGNNESGYGRVYVWVPGHPQYGTPVLLAAGDGNRFPPVRQRTEHEDQTAEVLWTMRWGRSGGGTHTSYLTGETVERRRGIQFGYSIDYGRESRHVRGSRLALTIPGYFSTTPDWSEVSPGIAPWDNLRLQVNASRRADGQNMALRLSGRMWHQHPSRVCSFSTMPESFFNVDLSVSPYMKPALYSSELSFQELVHSGVEIFVEPRWYSIVWNYSLHPWLGAATRRGSDFIPVAPNL